MHYKIVVIIILILATLTRISLAQDTRVQVQPQYEQIIYPFFSYENHINKWSYRAGGTISYYFSERISITSGVFYENKRYDVQYSFQQISAIDLVREEYKSSYMGVPLLLGIDLLKANAHVFGINLGVEFQKLIREEFRQIFSDGHTINEFNNNPYEYSRSLTLGVTYQYFINDHVFIALNPKTKLVPGIYKNTIDNSTAFSFLFRLSFGYEFM